jgi:PAS domain S-box-containing protein
MIDEAVVLADPSGVIRYWSGGAESLFGFPADEAVGQTLDLIVPAEHRQAHWTGFRRAFQAGAAAAEGQTAPFPARHANGEILPRPGRLTLVRRPQGDVVAALVVFE